MLFLKIQIISSIPFCFPLPLSSHQSLSSSLHCQLKFKAFYSSMVIAIHMGSPKLSISTGRHYVPVSKLVCQAREDNLVEKCLPFKQAWEPEFQSPELPLPTTHTHKSQLWYHVPLTQHWKIGQALVLAGQSAYLSGCRSVRNQVLK